MNSLKTKLKFERLEKPGGLWAELRAACQVYFVWAAMLAFVVGVALRELGVLAWPADWLPVLLGLLGLLAAAALLANRPLWLLPAFLLLGLAWSGLAELRLNSFAVPPDEAVFFRGRVVQVLEREENAFDALAETPRNGYSFIMQGEDQNGWRGRLLIVTAPVQPKAGDCLQVSGLVLDQSRTHNFSLRERDYLRSQSVAAAVRPTPQGIRFSRLAWRCASGCLRRWSRCHLCSRLCLKALALAKPVCSPTARAAFWRKVALCTCLRFPACM